jgi:hypothetical protein
VELNVLQEYFDYYAKVFTSGYEVLTADFTGKDIIVVNKDRQTEASHAFING